jgi:hypothetical protein
MWAYKDYNPKAPDPPTEPDKNPDPPAHPAGRFSWRSLLGDARLSSDAGKLSRLMRKPPQKLKALLGPRIPGGGGGEGGGSPRLPADPQTVNEIVELLAELLDERRRTRGTSIHSTGSRKKYDDGDNDGDEEGDLNGQERQGGEDSGSKLLGSGKRRASRRSSTPGPDRVKDDTESELERFDDDEVWSIASTPFKKPETVSSKPKPPADVPVKTHHKPSRPTKPSSPQHRPSVHSSATHTPQYFNWPTKDEIEQSLRERSQSQHEAASLARRTEAAPVTRTRSTVHLPERRLPRSRAVDTDSSTAHSDFSAESRHPSQSSFDVYLPSVPKHEPGARLSLIDKARREGRVSGSRSNPLEGRHLIPGAEARTKLAVVNRSSEPPPSSTEPAARAATPTGLSRILHQGRDKLDIPNDWLRIVSLMTECLGESWRLHIGSVGVAHPCCERRVAEVAKSLHAGQLNKHGSSSKSVESELLSNVGSYLFKQLGPLRQAASLFSQADKSASSALVERLMSLQVTLSRPEVFDNHWSDSTCHHVKSATEAVEKGRCYWR